MTRLLLIEDHDAKASAVEALVREVLPEVEITRARSYQSGVKCVLEAQFDVVLLDMTMPTFDVGKNEAGGKPQTFAGKYVLDQIDRYDLNVRVIVVTQFETFGLGRECVDIDSLDQQLCRLYPQIYRGKVYYHAAQSIWRIQLAEKLRDLMGK